MASSDHSQARTPGQARPDTSTSTGGGFGGSPPREVRAFEDAVIEAVRSIPSGEVMTYGEVAEAAGFPGRARGVGRILAISAEDMPWWRVVGSGLRLISPSSAEQAVTLGSEGWTVAGNRLVARRTDAARPAK